MLGNASTDDDAGGVVKRQQRDEAARDPLRVLRPNVGSAGVPLIAQSIQRGAGCDLLPALRQPAVARVPRAGDRDVATFGVLAVRGTHGRAALDHDGADPRAKRDAQDGAGLASGAPHILSETSDYGVVVDPRGHAQASLEATCQVDTGELRQRVGVVDLTRLQVNRSTGSDPDTHELAMFGDEPADHFRQPFDRVIVERSGRHGGTRKPDTGVIHYRRPRAGATEIDTGPKPSRWPNHFVTVQAAICTATPVRATCSR
jgi:hypothetical protein